VSELRRDPITGRSVIIAPERPFPRTTPVTAGGRDACPFCEGRESIAGRELLAWRPSGSAANGPDWQVRVVPNRVPVLRVESDFAETSDVLLQSLGGLGANEVVIESPRHDASFASMKADDIARVLWVWRERMRDLHRDIRLKSFLVVKSVGRTAGAMLDHPHSQLIALPLVPQHLEDELFGAAAYYRTGRRCAFCDLIAEEKEARLRIVGGDGHTLAVMPFAARVPFETWVLPQAHGAMFEDASDATLAAVAERVRDVVMRLDRVLVSPPYNLLLHTAPRGEMARTCYHWHFEIIPRLESVPGLAWDGGIYINPVAPEEAARAMRAVDSLRA